MPRPVAHKSGVFHLNSRVPGDLVAKVKGQVIHLPIDGRMVAVRPSDKVILSLRTKDPATAKARFGDAIQALNRHWQALRAGPQPITHKTAVALAGETYRRRTARFEDDLELTPSAMEAERQRMELDVTAWACGGETIVDEDGETSVTGAIQIESARFLAAIARPWGPELLAWQTWSDVRTDGVEVNLADALERLFGHEADALCAEKGLVTNAVGRDLLLQEIGKAVHDAADKLARNVAGDYSPDPAASRFLDFVPTTPQTASRKTTEPRKETFGALFERWVTYQDGKKAPSTIRRYRPSVASLDAWSKGRDWRLLSDADILAWARHRNEEDGIAATTVNRNDIVAISAVFAWATTLKGGKLALINPAAGIRLDPPKRQIPREKMFRHDEVVRILKLALGVAPDPRFPRASASRRWCPWLCAYSGARIQETLWLEKRDIRREGSIWVMDFRQTKDGHPRSVPLHEALIAEGFLDFASSAPHGFLFVGDRPPKPGSTRTAQEMRASELADWIRTHAGLDGDVSPNHAWRHTFISLAEGANIPKRLSNRITGHNAKRDASDGYVGGTVEMLAAEMRRFPTYMLG